MSLFLFKNRESASIIYSNPSTKFWFSLIKSIRWRRESISCLLLKKNFKREAIVKLLDHVPSVICCRVSKCATNIQRRKWSYITKYTVYISKMEEIVKVKVKSSSYVLRIVSHYYLPTSPQTNNPTKTINHNNFENEQLFCFPSFCHNISKSKLILYYDFHFFCIL